MKHDEYTAIIKAIAFVRLSRSEKTNRVGYSRERALRDEKKLRKLRFGAVPKAKYRFCLSTVKKIPPRRKTRSSELGRNGEPMSVGVDFRPSGGRESNTAPGF